MARTKRRFIWNIVFASLFVFSVVCGLLSLKGYISPQKFSDIKPPQLTNDEFDPSLVRLNTMARLEDYCDSFYNANSSTRAFPWIVSETLRKKFYHGYSYYDSYTNPLATFTAPLLESGLAAVVIANDIVKYPYAACSQQSIVGMEIFKRKGYKVREVIMYDTLERTGHFTYEVFYDGGWHFFDTDREPNSEVLKKYNRPSVAFLNEHPEVIEQAYSQEPELFKRLLRDSHAGPVNKNPAPVATLYQSSTKYLSYWGWLIVGLVMLIRYRILCRKSNMSLARSERNTNQFQPVRNNIQGREARA
jgi:hypothetical protein